MQIKKLNHFCIVLEIYLICISMQNMWRVPDLILTKKIPINQNFIFFLQTFRWCCNWQTVQKNGNSRNLIQHQQQSSPVQFPIGFPWGVSTNLRLWKLESLETWDFGEKPRLWKTETLKNREFEKINCNLAAIDLHKRSQIFADYMSLLEKKTEQI